MGIIRQLDYETAVLVAAGEMIERPASIVKELIENSVDAGATKITAEIQNGGITLIRVSDNGCGMSKEDLPMSIKRNATSKIRTSEDISKILTLGFRGEAPASIAACADLRIRSKRKEDEVGHELSMHPGDNTPTITESPMQGGTTIIVENLFATIPARRKFLKKDSTEAAHIADHFEKLALSNPSVAMTLIVDGKMRISTPGNGNLHNTIYSVFGHDFANKLIELSYKNNVKMYGGGGVDITVEGFIGTPDNMRGNRAHQIFFINGRSVKSACLQAALEQSCSSYMESSRFPACVMFITMPPEFVDVNIHPTKLEVKFVSDKAVFEAVYYAVRGALERHIPRPELDIKGKSIGDVNYELYRHLNKFTAIPDADEKAEVPAVKRVYNNQRNVKAGQLSVNDPIPAEAEIPSQKNLAEYEMVQKSVPSSGDECQQELFFEEIPSELEKKLTANGGAPVGAQKMYLGEIAPEVDSMLNSPREKCIVPEPPLGKMTDEEYERLRARYMAGGGTARHDSPVEKAENQQNEPATRKIPEYKIIGEVFLSYVIIEVEDKVMIIDKHAAHERIIYEDLRANMKRKLSSGEAEKQFLIAPLEIDAPSYYLEATREYGEDIRAIGFDFDTSECGKLSVSAIPAHLSLEGAREVMETVIDRLANGTGSVLTTRDIIFERALYQASCKAAIKIGREYTLEHIKWICDKLLSLDDIKVCPHGRPVAIEMTKSSLERQFKRV